MAPAERSRNWQAWSTPNNATLRCLLAILFRVFKTPLTGVRLSTNRARPTSMPSVFPMVRSSEREKTTVCNSGVCAARQACRTCLPDTGAAPTTDRDGSVHALCTGPLRTRFQQLRVELSLRVSHDFPEQHSVKQLLLRDAYSDIAQKHLASKFSFATDHRGRWDRMMKERLR